MAADDQQSSVERPQNEKRWSLCRSGYRARRGRDGGRRTASFELMKRRRGRDKAHHHCSRTKRDEGRNEHMVLSAPDGARPLPCYHPLGSAPLPHARRLILQITSMHGENTAAATTASLLPPSQLRGERELTRQQQLLRLKGRAYTRQAEGRGEGRKATTRGRGKREEEKKRPEEKE